MRFRCLIAVLGVLFFSGCGYQSDSKLDGLGYSETGNNIAVLIGSPNGLAGVPTDIVELTKMFNDPTYNFKFTVTPNGDADVDEILALTKEQAKDADSLFWYFSGHGGNGVLLASGYEEFTFSQVVKVIKEARNGVPLKRLIVGLDSCNSGSFVDGSSPIVDENAADMDAPEDDYIDDENLKTMMFEPLAKDPTLYEQAFVIASSKKTETSADLDSERGGAFTYSFRTTLGKLKLSMPEATFKDVAEQSRTLTQQVGGHTPVWKAFPVDTVINDYMFIYKN